MNHELLNNLTYVQEGLTHIANMLAKHDTCRKKLQIEYARELAPAGYSYRTPIDPTHLQVRKLVRIAALVFLAASAIGVSLLSGRGLGGITSPILCVAYLIWYNREKEQGRNMGFLLKVINFFAVTGLFSGVMILLASDNPASIFAYPVALVIGILAAFVVDRKQYSQQQAAYGETMRANEAAKQKAQKQTVENRQAEQRRAEDARGANPAVREEMVKVSNLIYGIHDKLLRETSSWYPIDHYNLVAVDFFIYVVRNQLADTPKEMMNQYLNEIRFQETQRTSQQQTALLEEIKHGIHDLRQGQLDTLSAMKQLEATMQNGFRNMNMANMVQMAQLRNLNAGIQDLNRSTKEQNDFLKYNKR